MSDLTLDDLLADIDRDLVDVGDIDGVGDTIFVEFVIGDETTDWIDYDDCPEWLQTKVDATLDAWNDADRETAHERRQLNGGQG